MNRTWTIYREDTGELLRQFDGPDGTELAQLSDGEALYEGALSLERKRIDVATHEPVEYIPPKPETRAIWDEVQWVWVTRSRRNLPIIGRIQELESQQARAVREAVLTGDKSALQAIENQIVTLRNTLES